MYSAQPMPGKAKVTHNIMALVGNGFDLQVLHEYGYPVTTSYTDFYYFLKMKKVSKSNLVFREMKKARKADPREDSWSDIEARIEALAGRGTKSVRAIKKSVTEVQVWFSEFLNYVVDTKLLSDLSTDTRRNRRTKKTLGMFLQDIETKSELKKVPFGMRGVNHELYNFSFINFNYTSLLDNFLYFDSKQFKPYPHSTVDTNFFLHTNPRKFPEDIKRRREFDYSLSVYLECNVLHPHGSQDIPRSLLFGIDGDGRERGDAAELAKPYWARVEQRYKHMFMETDLFVIFGCSMGTPDAWWWSNIAEALLYDHKNRGMIIYQWNADAAKKDSASKVIDRFFAGARCIDKDQQEVIAKKITVVSYSDEDERVWLNTKRKAKKR